MNTTQTNSAGLDTSIDQETSEEVGALVFESALMQYLALADENETAKFESYIEAHAADDDFLENLCTVYPDFGKIILDEMAILNEEIGELTGEVVPAVDDKNSLT